MKNAVLIIGPSTEESQADEVAFFRSELFPYAYDVSDVIIVGGAGVDDFAFSSVESSILSALKENDLIIIIGNSVAGQAVVDALNAPAMVSDACLKRAEEYFSNMLQELPEDYKRWAIVPTDSIMVENDHGPVNGFYYKTLFNGEKKAIVSFPAKPREYLPMFNQMMSYLAAEQDEFVEAHIIGVFGLSESALTARLSDLLSDNNPQVNLYPLSGDAVIQVVGKSVTKDTLREIVDPVLATIKERLGINIYGLDEGSLPKTAVLMLEEKGLKLSIAEDALKGRLAERFSQIPRVSKVLGCTILVDSDEKKMQYLDFSQEDLSVYKRTSAEMAALMAHKVKISGNADIGVAITEIGNEKAEEFNDVLVMYVALADNKRAWIKRIEVPFENVDGESAFIRFHAVSYATDLIRRYLEALPMVMAGGETLAALPYFSNLVLDDFDEEKHLDGEREDEEEKKPRKSLHQVIFPQKSDSTFDKIRKVALIALTCVLIALVIIVINGKSLISYFNKSLYKKLDNIYVGAQGESTVEDLNIPAGQILAEFSDLYEINSDVRGWIRIDGTKINYPIMLDDSDYYNDHDFERNSSIYGVPRFVQKTLRNSVEDDSTLAVYGNNFGDGQMFSDLSNFDDLNFLKEHALIEMNTLYQKAYWKVFSVMIIPKPSLDNSVFDYTKVSFEGAEEKQERINSVGELSIYDFSLEDSFAEKEDSLLFLSTDYSHVARRSDVEIVIVARKVREGEEPENTLADTTYKSEYSISSNAWMDMVFELAEDSTAGKDGTSTQSLKATTQTNTDGSIVTADDFDDNTTVESGATAPNSKGTDSQTKATTKATTPSTSATTPIPSVDVPTTIDVEDYNGIKELAMLSKVKVSGYDGATKTKDDWQKIISIIVKAEVGYSKYSDEALKAQAVAAYTKIIYDLEVIVPNKSFDIISNTRDREIYKLVGDVFGQKIMLNGSCINAMYYASSPGVTADFSDVYWGARAYLKPVQSAYDLESYRATNTPEAEFNETKKYSQDNLFSIMAGNLGISKGDISLSEGHTVFAVTKRDKYGYYVLETNAYYTKNGALHPITGKVFREAMNGAAGNYFLRIRSTCFTVSGSRDQLAISTIGYGHGIGLSQHGANGYARHNWDYKKILAHYYSFKSSGAKLFAARW